MKRQKGEKAILGLVLQESSMVSPQQKCLQLISHWLVPVNRVKECDET